MPDKLNVLIPTSGLGSRLGELTEHTNKCLVRVGTKAVISHIIDSYPAGTHFLVMIGHKGQLVRQYLTLAHPDLEVTYLERELHAGNLGLVRALREQADQIPEGPIIFHASDTIVDLPTEFLNARTLTPMVLGVPVCGDVHDYRTLRPAFGYVDRVQEKGEQTAIGDHVHIGVVRFHSRRCFIDSLNAGDNCCDTHMMNAAIHLGYPKFQLVQATNWFDTGNMSKLEAARKHFEVKDFVLLEKVDQGVYIVGDRVIKFFAEPTMVENRIERAKRLNDAIPEIIEPHGYNFFAYRKAKGELARDVMQPAEFHKFLDWAQEKLWTIKTVEIYSGFTRLSHEFYYAKTFSRITKFYEKTGLEDAEDMVNGRRLPTLDRLLYLVPWQQIIRENCPTPGMHGDLHFSNILVRPFVAETVQDLGKCRYTLLDWRESFAGSVECGDAYYDLAKLLHGLIVSHDMVEKDQYSIQIREEPGMKRVVTFDIMRHHRHVECEHVLKTWCEAHGWDWEHVQIVCALVFLNIAALHHYPYSRLLYFLGKSMLADCVL